VLRCPAEPRRDVGQVVRETLAAPHRDVTYELHRPRIAPAADERLAIERGVDGGAERPVAHAARLELLSDLIEQADRAAWIAALALHDPAHEVAEVLVGREALRRA